MFENFINVDDKALTCGKQSIEDILHEQQTNQEPDEAESDEHEEAITQKPTCNEATEHYNPL
jgi:hypothetical protein